MLLIKKYGNRRLYDTAESRYITQDELAAKIRGGVDVRVVDAKTNADLTQATLIQLILEGPGARLLPVGLLTQLVRLGDDALGEFFSRYVSGALDLYVQTRRGMQTVSASPADALMRLWMNPFAGLAGGGHPLGVDPQPAPARDDEVSALRREMDELKRRLRKRKP